MSRCCSKMIWYRTEGDESSGIGAKLEGSISSNVGHMGRRKVTTIVRFLTS